MKFSKEQLSLIKKQRIEFKNVKSNIGYKFTTLINATSRYGRDIAKYMKFWAKSMQYLITEKDYTVEQAAQETHIDCSRIVDLTGNMFSCAAWTLIKNWKYGKELEKWYRKEFLQENKNTSIPDKEPENDVSVKDDSNFESEIDSIYDDVMKTYIPTTNNLNEENDKTL